MMLCESAHTVRCLGVTYTRDSKGRQVPDTLVMELCDLGTLAGLIDLCNAARRPLDETTTTYILKQVFCGLETLQRNNLIHCDIKPENILLKMDRDTKQVYVKASWDLIWACMRMYLLGSVCPVQHEAAPRRLCFAIICLIATPRVRILSADVHLCVRYNCFVVFAAW